MLKYICLYIIISVSVHVFAQKEAANWVLPHNFWLDFNSNPPTQKTTAITQQTGICTSPMSDSLGNLLFIAGSYQSITNSIIDKNGNLISSFLSSSQLVLPNKLVIPIPQNKQKYYVFLSVYNTDVTPNNFGCYFTIIDMQLNNGLGSAVTGSTNILFNSDTIISVTGTKHSDCSGYWLILRSQTKFYAYLINSSGLNLAPVISNASSYINLNTGFQTFKVNPQGNKIAETTSNNQIICYDFNCTTGAITNNKIKDFTGIFNSIIAVEFSPDGSKLYFTTRNLSNLAQLNQVLISNGNIDFNNLSLIYNNTNSLDLVHLQIGIDSKIYISSSLIVNRQNFFSVINNPNLSGTNCNFIYKAIIAPLGVNFASKLPNFISSYFNPQACLDYTYTINCQSAQFTLNANSIQSVLWNFGDNQTSTLLNPTHTYVNTGTYTVTLIVIFTNIQQQTVTKQLTINPQPQIIKIVHK